MSIDWACSKPNQCTENCKLFTEIEPTGCVYDDEEDIPKTERIWVKIKMENNKQ